MLENDIIMSDYPLEDPADDLLGYAPYDKNLALALDKLSSQSMPPGYPTSWRHESILNLKLPM
ncbi:MAG: hypothetical protein PWQ68_2278 [Thermoanaerobacteraceae bacterium]|jgi:hypothetical protein|nr:hypothetical protein [Thermoanaerobacteraceae bacterium]